MVGNWVIRLCGDVTVKRVLEARSVLPQGASQALWARVAGVEPEEPLRAKRHLQPAGLKSPLLWGTEARLKELLGDGVSPLEAKRQHFVFRYSSPQHFVEFFRTHYGPTLKAFEALDETGKESLAKGIEALAEQFNRSTDGTLAIPSEYLEIVAVRR